jgi:hypothetical protein
MVRVQPKPGADGSYPVDRAVAVSGEKLLRDVMLENKLELYAAYVRQSPSLSLALPVLISLQILPAGECQPDTSTVC